MIQIWLQHRGEQEQMENNLCAHVITGSESGVYIQVN